MTRIHLKLPLRPVRSVLLVMIAAALGARPAAAQVLLVGAEGTGGVGQYNPTTGAAINASYINTFGNVPQGVAVDNANHLFIAYGSADTTVGQYNFVTGAAINTAFIQGLSFNEPTGIAVDSNNLSSC